MMKSTLVSRQLRPIVNSPVDVEHSEECQYDDGHRQGKELAPIACVQTDKSARTNDVTI